MPLVLWYLPGGIIILMFFRMLYWNEKRKLNFFFGSFHRASYLCLHRYRQRAQLLSNIHKDQPGHPVTRAVYWISYILRHNGANHLRSAVYEVSTYQYFLLDVIFTVGAILALTGFALRQFFRLLRGKPSAETDTLTRDDGSMANGHCHSESMANGKHKRNGSLKIEKKMN